MRLDLAQFVADARRYAAAGLKFVHACDDLRVGSDCLNFPVALMRLQEPRIAIHFPPYLPDAHDTRLIDRAVRELLLEVEAGDERAGDIHLFRQSVGTRHFMVQVADGAPPLMAHMSYQHGRCVEQPLDDKMTRLRRGVFRVPAFYRDVPLETMRVSLAGGEIVPLGGLD